MAYIYCFYFEAEPDRFYIGKTINNPIKRFTRHTSAMKLGKHHSKKVQDVYNNSITLPIFSILESNIPLDEVDSREQYYIQEFEAFNLGLNMTSGGEGVGYGPHSANSKYSKIQILKVFALLLKGKLPINEIAVRVKVPTSFIRSIRKGESHSWLHYEYPEEWNTLHNRNRIFNSTPTLSKLGKQSANFKSPEGIIFSNIKNINEFARNNGFNNPSSAGKMLSAVYNGSRQSYLGWTKV